MAEEIKLTKDMTIGEVFKLVGRDQVDRVSEAADGTRTTVKVRNPTLKNLEKAGLTMDSPFGSLQNEDILKKLGEVAPESAFTNLTSVQKAFKNAWNRKGEGAYPFKDVFGAGGIARDPDLKIAAANQARNTRKFKAVPEAQISLKKIVEGISKIEDTNTRAAVSFQSLVPLRPGEVHSLTVDDIDFETGRISEEFRRVHKIRNPVELPEVAMSILKAQRAKGNNKLFLTSTSKMSAAVTKHISPLFVDFEKAMGRKIAGAADIRKIVPSIIVSELGYKEEAKKIMGHASYDDIITDLNDIQGKHYVSKIMNQVGSSPKMALTALQNMYAEVLGLNTVNELGASLKLNLPDLEELGSIKINVVPKGNDIAGNVRIDSEGMSDSDLELINERKTARAAELKAATAEAEAKTIESEIKKEKGWAELAEEREKNKESRVMEKLDQQDFQKAKRYERDEEKRTADKANNLSELEKEKKLLKEKMGNTRMFGKFLGIGGLVYGASFIGGDYNAAQSANLQALEGDDDSFESRMRRGASQVVGPNVAAGAEAGVRFLDPGIQAGLELGPEAVKETFGASTVADATLNNDPLAQIKTGDQIRSGQQVMQDKADEQQYRGEVSPQVDDELAIQKQMNLKKQSGDFGNEAKRKSQLTLDQQLESLLQQREGDKYARQ
jgi:integrase